MRWFRLAVVDSAADALARRRSEDTTTARGVLTALGDRVTVSSSLPDDLLPLRRAVVDAALAANGISPGIAAGNPLEALRRVGAPGLETVADLIGAATAGMDSVSATALGFSEYGTRTGRDVEVAGVIVQRAHGCRHEHCIRDALPTDSSVGMRLGGAGHLG